MTSTVAEVVAAALQRHGVTDVFGQSMPSKAMLAAEDRGIRQSPPTPTPTRRSSAGTTRRSSLDEPRPTAARRAGEPDGDPACQGVMAEIVR
jgi:hypothetical protein